MWMQPTMQLHVKRKVKQLNLEGIRPVEGLENQRIRVMLPMSLMDPETLEFEIKM